MANEDKREEHDAFDIDPGLIDELTDNLHARPIVLFREGPVNALDQYKHPNAQGKPEVIDIEIDRPRRKIQITDYATGIEDEYDFKRFGTSRPKRVGGKSSSDKDSGVVGKKHIGKLTYRAASSKDSRDVWFYSNNGETGSILHMDKIGWCKTTYRDTVKVLPHVGLKVVINDVAFDELLKPTTVIKYISKVFAIRIARGALIRVNGKRVGLPPDFDSDWGREPLYTLSNGVKVRGNLTNSEKPGYYNIDVYENTVWVKSIHVEFKVKGWIDIEKMDLRTDREEFAQEEKGLYTECMTKFEGYLSNNGFKRQTEEKKERLSGVKELEDWMKNIMTDAMDLFPDLSVFDDIMKKKNIIAPEMNKPSNVNGTTQDEKMIKVENVAIIKDVLNKGKDVIIVGDGGGGGGGGGNGGDGSDKSDVMNGGDSVALVRQKVSIQSINTELIPPKFVPWEGSSEDPIIKFLDPARVGVNITRRAHRIIIAAEGKQRRDIIYPWQVRAFLDYAIRDHSISAAEYFEKYDKLLDKGYM